MSECAAPELAARRPTSEGDVVGFVGPYGEHVWLGIPYATPPVGALRWRPPQRAVRRTDLHHATAAGPSSAQRIPVYMASTVAPGSSAGSEDCLYLNIWAPAFPEDRVPTGNERLPVMFWTHGGANLVGQAASYGGGALATGSASSSCRTIARRARLVQACGAASGDD